jgi:hypothetical protein
MNAKLKVNSSLCEFLKFLRYVAEDFVRLVYNAVSLSNRDPTFRDNERSSPNYKRQKGSSCTFRPFDVRISRCAEKSEPIHIPEELNPEILYFQN